MKTKELDCKFDHMDGYLSNHMDHASIRRAEDCTSPRWTPEAGS